MTLSSENWRRWPTDAKRQLLERLKASSAAASPRRTLPSQEVVWPPPLTITLRGGALALYQSQDAEAMLAGPSETGKTYGTLHKLDMFLRSYPGAQGTVVRKVRATMDGSVLKTYRRLIAKRGAVRPYGGEKPEWFDYANGSRLWVAGIDNPGKALSSERDIIYVNQAEELSLDDWETLSTRCTGRGAVAPWTQLLGDCNPGSSTHWIKHREGLRFLESRHEDNPSLFRDDGTITPQGVKTLSVLDRLTGVRKERLRFGKWVSAEGVVYTEYDAAVHLIDRFDIPADWRRFRAIDFGYTNPFVCQWWAMDPDDNLYRYREMYMTGRTVEVHAAQINELSRGEVIEFTVADHDAEDRATLDSKGIPTIPADKAVSPGIQAVQERLKKATNGKPRLYFLRGSLVEVDESLREKRKPTCTEEEFDTYVWAQSQDGKPNKEAPVKLYDHGMDTTRYMVMAARKAGDLFAWGAGEDPDEDWDA